MRRRIAQLVIFLFAIALFVPSTAAAGGPDTNTLPVRDPQTPRELRMAGATPLATEATIPHWHGQFTDPTTGVSYGYNMVGSEDPRNVGAGTTTIPVDIIPLRLSFEANNGFALDGTNELGLTLASPIFQRSDFSYTAHSFGGAGVLSPGNVGVQYADAYMRSQFDKTGTDYHLVLAPSVRPTQSFTVPASKGTAYINTLGVIFGTVDVVWIDTHVQELLGQLHIDPTHLTIFLTANVVVVDHFGGWFLGYHSADHSANGNGVQGVKTYIYATYVRAGLFTELVEYLKDIHTLSHEIAEWVADPFIDNEVDPAFAASYLVSDCLPLLEVGDAVDFIGFTMLGNPDPRVATTGTWHLEDEVFLPWFARESPNVTSQPLQSGTGRRYTFMGDLNPFPIFRGPAPHC